MSVHDAEPGDIYVDASGKLWRVAGVCGEPTVHVEEIEPARKESPLKRAGGVSGAMWQGYKRIHRPSPAVLQDRFSGPCRDWGK